MHRTIVAWSVRKTVNAKGSDGTVPRSYLPQDWANSVAVKNNCVTCKQNMEASTSSEPSMQHQLHCTQRNLLKGRPLHFTNGFQHFWAKTRFFPQKETFHLLCATKSCAKKEIPTEMHFAWQSICSICMQFSSVRFSSVQTQVTEKLVHTRHCGQHDSPGQGERCWRVRRVGSENVTVHF